MTSVIYVSITLRWRGWERIRVALLVLLGRPVEVSAPLRESETQSLVDAAPRASEMVEEGRLN
jgi:hypothetical protein